MRRLGSRLGVVGLALAVVGSSLTVTQAAADEGQQADPTPVPVPSKAIESPDTFSAGVQARLQGSRVEDVSQRTESSKTFVNPDGTWTSELWGSPVQVRDAEGAWSDVDLRFKADGDGNFVPRASAADVVAGGGGSDLLGRLTLGDGSTVSFTWPEGHVPEPAIEGGVATYAVDEDRDVLVWLTSTGMNVAVRLNSAPEPGEGTVELGVLTQGAELTQDGDVLVLADGEGERVGESADLTAWDAREDGGGDPEVVVDVDPDLSDGETVKAARKVAKGKRAAAGDAPVVEQTLSLSVSEEFLQDPDTVYPVVVDPAVSSLTIAADTWVRSGTTTAQGSDYRWLVGATTTNANQGLTFAKWNLPANITGATVTAATLQMLQYEAGSCSTSIGTSVHPLGGAFSNATLWSNKPAPATGTSASTSFADNKGGDGCANSPNGWVTVSLKQMVQDWVSGVRANHGLQLNAPVAEASNPAYGKRFCSYNVDVNSGACFETARTPKLSVTYTKAPTNPSTVSFTQTGTVAGWTNAPQPVLKAKGTDPYGDNVRYEIQVHTSTAATAATLAGTCTTALVASGAEGSCQPGTALTSGTYYVRAKTINAFGLSSPGWAGWTTMGVDLDPPASPAITATAYTNGQWVTDLPGSNTFTITGSGSDLVAAAYKQDNGGWVTIPVSSGNTTTTFAWNPTGSHVLTAQLVDRAGNTTTSAFSFGNGLALPYLPRQGGVKATTATKILAHANGSVNGAVTARLQYRELNSGVSGWKDAQYAPLTISTSSIGSGMVQATGDWNIASELSTSRRPVTYEVQVCFTYPSNLELCTQQGGIWEEYSTRTVTYVPHAFGDAYPTSEAGPGTVSLWTGEFTHTATDVSVPGYTGDLSVSRTYNTFADASKMGPFGPGWTSSFDGVDAGVAGVEVYDDTASDGTIALVDSEGEALVYEQPGLTGTTTPAAQKVGVYLALDEETANMGARLEIKTVGSGKQLIFTEDDGTNTIWSWVSGAWQVLSVSEPGTSLTTSYTHTGGKLTRIVAPIPPKTGTPITCPIASPQPGCRILTIDYATATTATNTVPGDIVDQVKSISYTAFKPTASDGSGAMTTVVVASYKYDQDGRLVSVTDPRLNLITGYSYGAPINGNGVAALTSITPATVTTQLSSSLAPKPFLFTYATGSSSTAQAGALLSVSRPNPTGSGTTVLSKYGYDLSLSAAGMPDLTSADVATWGQDAAPTHGYAVWGQDRAGAIGTTPSTEDLRYADLSFTDDEGRVINTATFGAGDWQPTSTTYDTGNRVVRTIDARGIHHIRTALAGSQSVNPDDYATITKYNPDVIADTAITVDGETVPAGTVLTPAGTLVTDVWEPVREIRPLNGVPTYSRQRTHTDYDQGAPAQLNPATKMPWRLPTTVTVTTAAANTATWDPATVVPLETNALSQTETGYNPIDTSSPTGETSGWILGAPTTNAIVLVGGDNITTKTRYDSQGRVVEQRQPSGAASTTSYYTVDAQPAPNQACGGTTAKFAAWAGLTCRTVDGITTEQVTSYSHYLAVQETTESNGSVVRSTTNTFDTAGRQVTSKTSINNQPDTSGTLFTSYGYSTITSQLTTTSALSANGATTLGTENDYYDAWERAISHVSTTGSQISSTLTAYDAAGRVYQVEDPNGTTTFGYDGPGEYRGLVTSQTVTGMGTWTAVYDAAGDMTSQTSPGGLVQTNTFDRTGQQTTLAYASSTGTPIATWDTGWNSEGKKAWVTGPASDGGLRTVNYEYDTADRLTQVRDRISNTCQIRGYTFDSNGNRTGLYRNTINGQCAYLGSTPSSRTWGYDAADRVAGAYEYDMLGRQTQIPSTDAPLGEAAGPITIGYYDNDLARSITQGENTTTFTLDALQRRLVETRTTGSGTTTIRRGYADTSDNPGWATTTKNGTTTLTRYASSIAGDLGAQHTGTDLTLDIVDPWDSVAATITVTGTTLGTISGLSSFDEYGNPLTTTPTTGDITYGWKGGKERAGNPTSGLTLMGVRLYNPTTGLFTSPDPVKGGNTTAYTYPQDPINWNDLSGLMQKYELTDAEWVAIANKKAGLPYDNRAFHSGKRKQVANEKFKRERDIPKREGYTKNSGQKSSSKSKSKAQKKVENHEKNISNNRGGTARSQMRGGGGGGSAGRITGIGGGGGRIRNLYR
ncbi:hypothetical protein GCM10010401_08550 [Rarobacter faecitabidus]|uniref:RHS repeat-associated protein n=1 Tax=Rarobacter faecitabidus TaxID=13243 RepID=A0A542ZAX3_RARFA|nr:DNRLRE domain-containing protein [Rarobacter faecitabidus]TQL57456.1 RHS repeat-associated protein [Rarobacter faecitabidus]